MAKSEEERPIIVIKKIKKGGHGHHGGAWKIAYADFVTAMMAFFLLMWLLGSTSEGDLKGISDYFNSPLKVSLMGGEGSGTSTSILNGGGTDLSRTVGQIKSGSNDAPTNLNNANNPEQAEAQRLSELKIDLEEIIEASALMQQFKDQIILDITPEGLRIQLVDEKNRPMFDSGSAVLKDYMKVILRNLAKVLNQVPNKITLSGHTDATPYSLGNAGYSNWELSVDRANSSRRELLLNGVSDSKILRVQGMASSVPLVESDPYAPVNRRIAIVVMNKKTEESIIKLGKSESQESKNKVELPSIPPIDRLPGALPVAN